MLRYLYLLLLMGFTSAALAQKVDLDEFKYTVSYIDLPRNPLPTELTTYSCDFSTVGFDLMALGFTMTELRTNYFAISGFKKVPRGGHFTIKIQIDLPVSEPVTEVSDTKTTKDKDGKETKTTTYAYTSNAYVPMRYVIADYQQNIVQEGALTENNRSMAFKTDYFATQALLQEHWKKNGSAIINQQWRSYLNGAMSDFSSRLNNDYGYVVRNRLTRTLWILNSSKHPEFDAYQRAYQTIKAGFDEMSSAQPLDPAKFAPAIAYLDSLPLRYTADEKAHRKLRYSTYYNLGWLYYWCDNFGKATEYANALYKNDYDRRDADDLKQAIGYAESRLKANRLTSRHLVRETANAQPPQTEPQPPAVEELIEAKKIAETAEEQKKAKTQASLYDLKGSIDELTALLERIEKRREADRIKAKAMDAVIAKDPKNAKLHYQQGQLYIEGTDFKAALNSFDKAVALKPTDENYLRFSGETAMRLGEYDRGMATYDKGLTINPKNPHLLILKASALFNTGRYEAALPAYDQAIAQSPKIVELLISRGFTKDYLEQYEAALADFDKAAVMAPKNIETHLGKGMIKTTLGRYDDALADFDQALTIQTYNARVRGNRAVALMNVNRADEAGKDIEQALRIDPKYPNGYYIRAWMRVKQQNFQGAIEDARKALSLNHTKPHKVYTTLGDAMLGLGITSEAVKNYDEALKLKPTFAGALTGRQKAISTK